MDPIEYHTIDKSTWDDGPWKSEPDKKQWTDPDTGLWCLVMRGPMGDLCGYVGVPATHPFSGVGYSSKAPEMDCGDMCHKDGDYHCECTPGWIIEVHGGLTFSGSWIEEVSSDIPFTTHWFGFDCGHGGDYLPALYPDPKLRAEMKAKFSDGHEIYRDLAYVEAQVTSLAKQLKALEFA